MTTSTADTATSIYDAVKRDIPIERAYRQLEERPKISGRGAERSIRCPHRDHPDENPSAAMNVENGSWYCHSSDCPAGGGSVIDMAMAARGLSKLEAAKWLAAEFNVSHSERQPISRPDDPLEELAERRGNWTAEALRQIANANGRKVYFPLRNADGENIGRNQRRGDNKKVYVKSEDKWVKSKSSGKHGLIYPDGLDEADDPVLVVEGEADVAAALSAGHDAVVGTPGGTPGRDCWEYLQELVAGRDVVLTPDPGAGEWRDKAGRKLRDVQCDVRYIPPHNGHDIDERLKYDGADLEALIRDALTWIDPDAENPLEAFTPDGEDATGKTLYYAAAQYLKERGRFMPVQSLTDATLFAYRDGLWHSNARQILREKVAPLLDSDLSRHGLAEIEHHLLADRAVDRDTLGLPPGKVACANGILDLDSRKLRGLQPEDKALWRLPVEYDPDAECPEIDAFLRDMVQSDEQRAAIWEFMGYALQGRNHFKKALILFGPTDAGKSVLLHIIHSLFGEENDAQESIQRIANHAWATAELYGKPINTRSDLSASVIYNVGIVKELISGDPVKGERKFQDPFRFKPRTKFAFAANQAPERSTEDDAFWNRWITLVFPERVPEDQQNPSLPDKLTTDAELSGALNKALDGWQRLKQEEGFSYAPSPVETQQLWYGFGDSLESFLSKFVDQDPDAWTPKDDLYEAYSRYAREQNDEVESKQKVTQELQKRGAQIKQRRRDSDGKRIRVYAGVNLDMNALHDELGDTADSDTEREGYDVTDGEPPF